MKHCNSFVIVLKKGDNMLSLFISLAGRDMDNEREKIFFHAKQHSAQPVRKWAEPVYLLAE
jgi:hypothetical protein